MVDRPFADRRPVGPLMDVDFSRDDGQKVQLGVSGTSMPDVTKSDLNILYVLDTHIASLPRDVKSDTLLDKVRDKVVVDEDRIGDRLFPPVTLNADRSGVTAATPFEEQAIVLNLSPSALPIQEGEVNRVANVIERHYSDMDLNVKNIIFDTE